MKLSEKIKLIRKANNLTQSEFAKSIGVSRSNLANIEIEKVEPTPLFINCVSLMYNVNKNWLLDDSNNDLSALNGSTNLLTLITEKYEQLDDRYKKFVENQINEMLEWQKQDESQEQEEF